MSDFPPICERVRNLRDRGFTRDEILQNAQEQGWATRQQAKLAFQFLSQDWGIPDEELMQRDIKMEALKAENSRLKSERRFLRKQADIVERFIDYFGRTQIPVTPIPIKQVQAEGTKQAAIFLASDEHLAAEVSYERLNGINEYDMNLARRRMIYVYEVVAEHINRFWKDKRITRLIDANLGDKFQGSIHDSDVTNLAEIADAVRMWQQTKSDCYEMLLRRCPGLRITSLHLSGNHPRRTQKQDVNRPFNNDDALAAIGLELLFRNEPRVEFQIPCSYWRPLIIEDHHHVYNFTHGQFIRSWAGIPLYGILRYYQALTQLLEKTDIYKSLMHNMVSKLIEKHGSEMTVDQMPNIEKHFALGHFHTTCKGLDTVQGTVMMNGSLIGPEDYGISLALASPPKQLLFAAHPTNGPTDAIAIRLDHIVHKRDMKPLDVLEPIVVAA